MHQQSVVAGESLVEQPALTRVARSRTPDDSSAGTLAGLVVRLARPLQAGLGRPTFVRIARDSARSTPLRTDSIGAAGFVPIRQLAPGSYFVSVHRLGYHPQSLALVLRRGLVDTLEFRLGFVGP
jgi:hypothetical protein